MSNLLPSPIPDECTGAAVIVPSLEALPKRSAEIGPLNVQRVLPVRGRRLIGPWCFFDRYGPLSFGPEKPMDVAPHPHIGLQTVSWLIEGEVIHNDSLGSECLVGSQHLSLMTAGRGIAHSEETPRNNSGRLNGAQLWVALPGHARSMPPEFQCTKQLPVLEQRGGRITVFLGELDGNRSPGRVHSPCVGADVAVHKGASVHISLQRSFEHGLMLVAGDATLERVVLQRDTLYYIGTHHGELGISSREGARLILIGGAPFGETILMWWNFVARSQDELMQARASWENNEHFGPVPKYNGPRLQAPPFAGRPIPSS